MVSDFAINNSEAWLLNVILSLKNYIIRFSKAKSFMYKYISHAKRSKRLK